MPNSPENAQKTPIFSGEFRPALDEKKRLTIPARWRSDSRLDLYIVKSRGRGCLSAMPEAVLQGIGEKAAPLAPSVADHQTFRDQLFSSAFFCPVDSQGRMVLTEELCRFAGIKKEVVLTGGDTKFDIWSPEKWAEQQQAAAPVYESILRSLGL